MRGAEADEGQKRADQEEGGEVVAEGAVEETVAAFSGETAQREVA